MEAGHFRSIVRTSYVSEIVLTSLHSLTCFLISLDGIYFTPMQDDGREAFERDARSWIRYSQVDWS